MIHFWRSVVDPRKNQQAVKLFRQLSAVAQAKTKDVAEPKSEEKKDTKTSPSFVMNLFRGEMNTSQIFPFPEPLTDEQKETLLMLKDPFEKFFEEVNNPDKNDIDEAVEKKTLDGLWEMGAFSIQVPGDYGGLGLNNTQYARLVEIVGKNDLAVGICLGAHQSIGFKGILLFGNPQQKEKYLPMVSTGQVYAAFCLTEPSSGSDAASIRSRAVLSPDGSHWVLNGSKIWISNGGIADILTVFAQTTVKDEKTGEEKDKITAFIVERGFGGVTSGPPEKKMGIKASNTTEIFFDGVKIPNENVLGGVGNGFKVAMNILNNGRFGMAACLAGTMKICITKAAEFASQRTQFGRKIITFETIQEKLARMSMLQYVAESLAYMVSGNMDMGSSDYHLEAAISKVFASEAAWQVSDEAIQVMGGMGYMRATGLERVMRNLRIFRIFEGTNEILRLFVALTGLQYGGIKLLQLERMLKNPATNLIGLVREGAKMVPAFKRTTLSPLVHPNLAVENSLCAKCGNLIGETSSTLLRTYKRKVFEEQFLLHRLAEAVINTYTMAVVISRCTTSLNNNLPTAKYEENITKSWCFEAHQKVLTSIEQITGPNKHAYLSQFARMSDISKAVCDNGGVVQNNPLGI